MGLLEVLAITPETMRWAYLDDAQGRKQGNVDWYCNKTVDACYDGQTCRQVAATMLHCLLQLVIKVITRLITVNIKCHVKML